MHHATKAAEHHLAAAIHEVSPHHEVTKHVERKVEHVKIDPSSFESPRPHHTIGHKIVETVVSEHHATPVHESVTHKPTLHAIAGPAHAEHAAGTHSYGHRHTAVPKHEVAVAAPEHAMSVDHHGIRLDHPHVAAAHAMHHQVPHHAAVTVVTDPHHAEHKSVVHLEEPAHITDAHFTASHHGASHQGEPLHHSTAATHHETITHHATAAHHPTTHHSTAAEHHMQ